MIRGFQEVENRFLKGTKLSFLPEQGTIGSAGYDFKSNDNFNIKPNESVKIYTNIKAYMVMDEVLEVYVRSSIGIKKNLMLSNVTGIIDSTYYQNPKNDGNIIISLYNYGTEIQEIKIGDKIVQGIFKKYLSSDNGNSDVERVSGLGSTGK
jgi:dUTP pyrophosphatase